jgi:hypothetical protein
MQVRDEGGVGVGAGVDGAIVVVVLGNRDPLGSEKLLFQVTGDGLLFFPIEGGRASSRVLCAAATAATRASYSRCAVAAAA